jgi:sporulation protein YlmC with PRC-barrel domain
MTCAGDLQVSVSIPLLLTGEDGDKMGTLTNTTILVERSSIHTFSVLPGQSVSLGATDLPQ